MIQETAQKGKQELAKELVEAMKVAVTQHDSALNSQEFEDRLTAFATHLMKQIGGAERSVRTTDKG